MHLWLIYANPIVLTVASIGYFSPFFFPVVPGGVSGMLVANVLLVFLVSGLTAWLIAGWQAILAVIELRKGKPLWMHHLVSALWTYACYGIVITLMSNGYMLLA